MVQQGSYLSSRTAFVPFLDIPLEVKRSMCGAGATEGIDSGIEDDAKIVGDDAVVSLNSLFFFGVKGIVESAE